MVPWCNHHKLFKLSYIIYCQLNSAKLCTDLWRWCLLIASFTLAFGALALPISLSFLLSLCNVTLHLQRYVIPSVRLSVRLSVCVSSSWTWLVQKVHDTRWTGSCCAPLTRYRIVCDLPNRFIAGDRITPKVMSATGIHSGANISRNMGYFSRESNIVNNWLTW